MALVVFVIGSALDVGMVAFAAMLVSVRERVPKNPKQYRKAKQRKNRCRPCLPVLRSAPYPERKEGLSESDHRVDLVGTTRF